MMQETTDEELVLAVQSGDIPAFETLVHRYQHSLQYYVLRYVGSKESAAEVVQDTLFSLYQTIERVDTSRKVKSYIYRIARNVAISYLRTHHTDRRLNEMIAQEEKTDLSHIHDAVNHLPVSYRAVIRLYYFDELSYKEISEKLHMPINTVRTHLSRAKKSLKVYLKTV